ncbi:Cell wall assembly regulator [Rhodotorula toruloides]
MPNASKRALAALQSSQASSQATLSQQRPAKRPRVTAPPAPPSASRSGDNSSSLPQEPSTLVSQVPETPSQPQASRRSAQEDGAEPQDGLPPLPQPKKRQRNPGKLRRLSTDHPPTTSTALRPKSTLSGAKIGGKAKDLKDGVQAEEIWVKRQKGGTTGQGLGFAGYLKMGVKAFVERGCTTVTLHALGAAIPLCLSLALAIRDALPGGEPLDPFASSTDSADSHDSGNVKMEVVTGSKVVHDEVTPEDEDEDLVYQSRTKSTVSGSHMFSKFFGGSKSRSAGSASGSRSERDYPSTYGDGGVASYPTSPNSIADGSQYDEVTFGGGGDLADTALSNAGQPRPSISQDGAFVGSSSYYPPRQSVESSYPPLPSFSRPSSNATTSTRYPPLRATFARLHTLLDSNSPALLDTLSPPLAPEDPALASLQAAIAPYRLPQAVIDSYLQGHDGQDPLAYFGGSSTGGASGGASLGGLGLVYGLWWLPLDRVEEEWRFWRRLEEAGGLSAGSGLGGDAFSASASEAAKRKRHTARTHPYVPEEDARSQTSTSSAVQDERGVPMQGMSSFPDGWVRKRYSHPGWLPLLTDRCGNYIGVDLDPPPPSSSSDPTSPTAPGAPGSSARTYGQPGQVIAFGREIDEKVVLFPGHGPGGWARFLAAFVEDLEKGEVARVGERPSDAIGGRTANGRRARRRWSDDGDNEERGSRRDASSSSSSGDEFDDSGDGLGERAYFETGMDGEEIFGDTPRNAQTWVLRSEYRRMLAQLPPESGIVALLCERSRRKWRSLGVGSAQPRATLIQPAPRRPLSIVLPPPDQQKVDVEAVGAEGEAGIAEEPKSTATERPPPGPFGPSDERSKENTAPSDPLTGSEPPSSAVSLVLSPPSPSDSTPPPDSSASTSHLMRNGSRSPPNGYDTRYLRDPPRSSRVRQQQQPRKRAPPPPPAPIELPLFTDLDFSDALPSPAPGQKPPVAPGASWLLSDGRAGGGMLSRLSISSQPSDTILPLSHKSSSRALKHQRQPSQETVASLANRNTSRTALVGESPTDGKPASGASALASPIEEVEVVSHRGE